MPPFKGVIVYEILPNGCLNGIYSNDAMSTTNEIFNEIARKIPNANKDEILGKYACSYIDLGNKIEICDLEINAPPSKKGQYQFTWTKKGTKIFEGIGWLTRHNQITVSYWDV